MLHNMIYLHSGISCKTISLYWIRDQNIIHSTWHWLIQDMHCDFLARWISLACDFRPGNSVYQEPLCDKTYYYRYIWKYTFICYFIISFHILIYFQWDHGAMYLMCCNTSPNCRDIAILQHDDAIIWKRFLRHWPFVRVIRWIHHRIPITKASSAELFCFLWYEWTNSGVTIDLRHHGDHVTSP